MTFDDNNGRDLLPIANFLKEQPGDKILRVALESSHIVEGAPPLHVKLSLDAKDPIAMAGLRIGAAYVLLTGHWCGGQQIRLMSDYVDQTVWMAICQHGPSAEGDGSVWNVRLWLVLPPISGRASHALCFHWRVLCVGNDVLTSVEIPVSPPA